MKTPEDIIAAAPSVTAAPLEMDERSATRHRLADSRPTTRLGRWKETIRYMRGRGALEIGSIYLAIVVTFVVMYLRNSRGFPFLNRANTSGTLSQNIPVLAILAIGAGVLMIAGEFDLSIGASIGFSAIIFIRTAENHSWVLAFVAAVGCAMGIALLNGLIVVVTRIPSFIATLGMSFFWAGATSLLNGNTPARMEKGKTKLVVNLFAGDHGRFRSQLIWMLVIGVIMWFVLHRRKWGNHAYATGGNEAAATAVSIRPKLVKLQAFALYGVLTGVASVLLAVRAGNMQPNTTGEYTLYAIAAAVIGGCSLTGGRGTVIGMVIGGAFIRTVENGILLHKASAFWVQMFVGLTIVVATVLNRLVEGKAK
jgi:simple sugar transport system permease protein